MASAVHELQERIDSLKHKLSDEEYLELSNTVKRVARSRPERLRPRLVHLLHTTPVKKDGVYHIETRSVFRWVRFSPANYRDYTPEQSFEAGCKVSICAGREMIRDHEDSCNARFPPWSRSGPEAEVRYSRFIFLHFMPDTPEVMATDESDEGETEFD